MIQASNIHKAYGRQVVFDDIGFTVNQGERIGLVGRNGHGKTTLLRMITGEEKPDSGVIQVPAHYRIGYLSQHLRFFSDSALQEACRGIPSTEDGRDETYKAETILMGLGFTRDDLSRRPDNLSGGYQVRLHLARLLVSAPNLLLLDEPTNYLDIVSIRWLSGFLKSWQGELILITHDRDFMGSVTTHTLGIHRSRIKKIPGPTEKLYQQILIEEEVHEKTRLNEERKRAEVEQFINRFRAQATRARAVQSKIKALRRHERLDRLQEIKDLEFQFTSAPFTGKWLMAARDISFSFDPETAPLIDGLSLTIGKRDRIAVIGKNGKGKTTLLNLLAGELTPRSGGIVRDPKLSLAYFGQTNIQRLDPAKTIEQEIINIHPEGSRKASRAICGNMMFEGDNALKKIEVLSGGEKSRVLLGKLLVSPANLLLLDEPTNHLDMESVDSLLGAIDAFDGSVVIVTHSEMILHSIATRLVVFDGGEARIFEGTYQDFLDRVGWRGEDQTGNGAVQDAAGKSAVVNRKDLRRLRAEVITRRSQTLGPMEARIADIEETIILLERQVEEDTQALVDASVRGEGGPISRLSKAIGEAKGRIESLFDELSALTDEHASLSKDFEKELEGLSAGA